MGVELADCRIVARMTGVKTFVNEFIAYEDLGQVKRNRILYEQYQSSGRSGAWSVDGASNWILTEEINASSPWVVLSLKGTQVFNDTNIVLKGGVISVSLNLDSHIFLTLKCLSCQSSDNRSNRIV